MQIDLTRGSVFKNILFFSGPFLLSYFLQTLYGMADLYITGQFNGTASISAVAIGSQVMHMVTVIIVGLAMGPAVLVGRAVGEKNKEKLSSVTGNSIVLFVIIAALFTLVLTLCLSPIVALMKTPQESVQETQAYLLVCFCGIPLVTAYNVIASLFRGLGDSKSPLFFIALACIFNIALDFLFIGVCNWGAQGAAWATVISQAVSVLVSLLYMKKTSGIRLTREDLRLHSQTVGDMLIIGGPVACQDGFIQISFLLITIIANGRGLAVATAVGIVEKIITFLFLVPSTMLSCISAIASQCIGAGQELRARKTLWCGTALALSAGCLFALIAQFASVQILSLFTDDASVIRLGAQYFRAYSFDCIAAAVHFSFSGYFCAVGLSLVSFIHNVISILLVRIPGAWLSAKWWPQNLYPMGLAAPLGSLLSSLICLGVYVWLLRSKKNALC